jgi:hypothetical protein
MIGPYFARRPSWGSFGVVTSEVTAVALGPGGAVKVLFGAGWDAERYADFLATVAYVQAALGASFHRDF